MDWGRAEGCQAGGQKTAPGHGREPQADGLGGKQRQREGGTLQEAGGKDDEGSVPQEACSGKETPLKAGSGEGGTLQEAGEGEVEGGSPLEEGEVEGGSPLEEGEVEGGSPLEEGEVEGGPPLEEGQVEGGPPLEGGTPQEGKVEGWSPLEEGEAEGGPPLEGGTPQEGKVEGWSPTAGAIEGAIRRESVPVQPHHTPPGAWPRHPQAVHHLGHSVEDLPRPLPGAPQYRADPLFLTGQYTHTLAPGVRSSRPNMRAAGVQWLDCWLFKFKFKF
ncbi:unnamed protein product [Boreogadus saida]